jgi:PAS domain-containing protein
MKPVFFAKIILLFLFGLVVVFIIDPLDETTISTPFLLGIILMGLSLRQSTLLVAATSIIYCFLTVYALIAAHIYFATHTYANPHPYFWLFQRMGLFLVVSGLATYLAHYRTNTQIILSNLQNIMAKLPAPVVVSDAAGYIVYANDALSKAFNRDAGKLKGLRYVDFLMTDIQEGKAMRYYIELFGDQVNEVHELQIKPFESESTVKARLTCLGSGPDRVMITLISNAEKLPDQPKKRPASIAG